MRKRRCHEAVNWTAGLVLLAVLTVPTPGLAQEPDAEEPLLGELIRRFQTKPLTLGMLVQVVGNYAEGSDPVFRDGFVVGNMRLRVNGELDSGWSYLFQTNFVLSPAILDARIGYVTASGLRFDAGRFKTPVSHEFLTYAGSIDFVNRSRAVALLAPGRQTGVQVSRSTERGLAWFAGIFSGQRNLSTEDAVLVAGRLESRTGAEDSERLTVGVNVGYGQNEAIARALIIDGFTGDGWVGGVDARYTLGAYLLAAEVLASQLKADDGSIDGTTWGHHLTAGWMWATNRQLLLRWDRFDDIEDGADDALVFGLNVWPTAATEVQVNYLLPVSGVVSRHQLLVNFQLGF